MTGTRRTWLLIAVLAAGVALRATQYAARSSLWVDEAALARNIVARPAGALAAPLDFAQYAPIGFLLLQKAIAALGTGELALRAVPFLSSLLALALFVVLAREALRPPAPIVAVAMVALASPFVYFGSQAKQYSSDVTIAIAVTLSTLCALRRGWTTTGWLLIGVLGAVSCFFSHPASLVVAGLGLAILTLRFTSSSHLPARTVMAVVIPWTIGAAGAAALALSSVARQDFQYAQEYWTAWFLPVPPTGWSDVAWLWTHLVAMFGVPPFAPPRLDGGLRYAWSAVYALLALIGFASWFRRGHTATALAVGFPIVASIGASAARLYPFGGRMSIYMLPGLILAAAEGWDAICRVTLDRRHLRLVGIIVMLLPAVVAVARNMPPFYLEHTRPTIEHIRGEWQAGDVLYVYYGAGQAFLYYAPRFGFTTADYVIGTCARADPAAYVRELQSFYGRSRVWTLFTHSIADGAEFVFLRDFLDRVGRRIDALEIPAGGAHVGAGAYAYLYDLSRPATADLTIPPPFDLWPSACYGTMAPERTIAVGGY